MTQIYVCSRIAERPIGKRKHTRKYSNGKPSTYKDDLTIFKRVKTFADRD